jgi:hypothetical protein
MNNYPEDIHNYDSHPSSPLFKERYKASIMCSRKEIFRLPIAPDPSAIEHVKSEYKEFKSFSEFDDWENFE